MYLQRYLIAKSLEADAPLANAMRYECANQPQRILGGEKQTELAEGDLVRPHYL
jgi:hypothetical protein